MEKIDLHLLSLGELKTLKKDVEKAIKTFEERQRKEALAAAEAKAREMGFTLEELLGRSKKSPKKSSPPKYRHPENPAKTWSGRGRQPVWFKEALEAGKTPEDLEV